jgi:hypothetical protein
VSDLRPLSPLLSLEKVCAAGSLVSDLAPLATLTRLNYLDVSCCVCVEVISPLLASLAPCLEQLDISSTCVSDLGAIPWASFARLRCVKMQDCLVEDIEPLSALPNIRLLDV